MNPTSAVSLDFSQYAADREASQSAHRLEGLPDYSFRTDNTLRKQIMKVPAQYKLCRAYLSSIHGS